MEETKSYLVLDSLKHNGIKYLADAKSTVDLTEGEAKPLLASGVVGLFDGGQGDGGQGDGGQGDGGQGDGGQGDGGQGDGGQGDGGGNNPPEGEEKTQAIKDAILSLDKENADLFTKSGAPKTDAIEAVTGWPVSANERDATIEALTAEGLLGAE